MISSLEHRCSRVEAGPGRYFTRNGVNRCGTNRTERTTGGGGGGADGEREWARKRAKKSGRAAGHPAQLTMSFYLACARKRCTGSRDVKCMYNLQTENYFNCGAKHPAPSINQRGFARRAEKKDRKRTVQRVSPLTVFLSREYRVDSLVEIRFELSAILSSFPPERDSAPRGEGN